MQPDVNNPKLNLAVSSYPHCSSIARNVPLYPVRACYAKALK